MKEFQSLPTNKLPQFEDLLEKSLICHLEAIGFQLMSKYWLNLELLMGKGKLLKEYQRKFHQW